MSKYIIRLDDACEKRNIENLDRMENLLDSYGVNPLVGVLPDCQDSMMEKYPTDRDFWNRVHAWEKNECLTVDDILKNTKRDSNMK